MTELEPITDCPKCGHADAVDTGAFFNAINDNGAVICMFCGHDAPLGDFLVKVREEIARVQHAAKTPRGDVS